MVRTSHERSENVAAGKDLLFPDRRDGSAARVHGSRLAVRKCGGHCCSVAVVGASAVSEYSEGRARLDSLALVRVAGAGHYAEGPSGDEKRPTPCPSHQRSPVALNLRPVLPASSSALWRRGQTGSTSRRQDAASLGSPEHAVKAWSAVGPRPQKVQAGIPQQTPGSTPCQCRGHAPQAATSCVERQGQRGPLSMCDAVRSTFLRPAFLVGARIIDIPLADATEARAVRDFGPPDEYVPGTAIQPGRGRGRRRDHHPSATTLKGHWRALVPVKREKPHESDALSFHRIGLCMRCLLLWL